MLRRYILIILVVFLFLAGVTLLYKSIFFPYTSLVSSDANAGAVKLVKEHLSKGHFIEWFNEILLGMRSSIAIPTDPLMLLYLLFPIDKVPSYVVLAYIVLAGIFMYWFLRLSGLDVYGSVFGAVSWGFVGKIVSLAFAGHLLGIQSYIYVTLAFTLLMVGYKHRSIVAYLSSAGFLGLALQLHYVALYFAVVYGFLFIYLELFNEGIKKDWKSWVNTGILGLVMVLIILLSGLHQLQAGIRLLTGEEKPLISTEKQEKPKSYFARKIKEIEEKKEFLVQFSFPPEEILDLFIGGFFGIKSGDAEFPYYGRVGRSFDYEITGKGFKDLKLHTENIGVLTFFFALVAIAFLLKEKRILIFWLVTVIISLLLAFGRYFPIPIFLWYMLPFTTTFRNPIQFTNITAFALVILASYGFDAVARELEEFSNQKKKNLELTRKALTLGFIYLFFIGFIWIFVGAFRGMLENSFVSGGILHWSPTEAQKIVSGMFYYSFLALILAVIGITLLYISTRKVSKTWIYTAIYLIVIVNFLHLYILDSKYMETVDIKNMLEEDELIKFLKSEYEVDKGFRVMFLHNGLLNYYLNMPVQLHDVWTIQSLAISRLPEDYSLFFQVISANPGVYGFYSTKYVVNISQGWAFSNIPFTSFYTNIFLQNFRIPLEIHLFNTYIPKAYFVYNYKVIPELEKQKEYMQNVAWDPLKEVLLTEEPNITNINAEVSNEVYIEEYRRDYAKLKVVVNKPGILVFNDYFDNIWDAFLNGEKVKIYRANVLVRAIPFDKSGTYSLEFKLKKVQGIGTYISSIVIALCIIGIVSIVNILVKL